jgi:tetratricopeptide (TPR) repeat protein
MIKSKIFLIICFLFSLFTGFVAIHRPSQDWSQIYLKKGMAYESKGRHEDALYEYKSASMVDPHNSQAHYRTAVLQTKLGNCESAFEHFNLIEGTGIISEEANSKRGECYYKRGMIFKAKGNLEDAVKDLEMAIKLGYRSEEKTDENKNTN